MKIWQTFVMTGGVLGLCLIPLLDVFVYVNMMWYAQDPTALLVMLERIALMGLILKYWLVVVGLVGLIGWSFETKPKD